MGHFHFAIRFFAGVVFASACCGCVAFHRAKSIDVLVLDAETGEAIRDATINVSHGPRGIDPAWALTINKPGSATAVTGADGLAKIDVAKFGWIYWGAKAPHYLSRGAMSHDGDRVPPSFARNSDIRAGAQAVIRLYRGPAPTLAIVIPNGYRGPLLIDKRPVEHWIQGDVGERDFVFHANERGYVTLNATPLLLEHIESYTAMPVRYASGEAVPEKYGLDDDAVALRWMTSGHAYKIFVVGTQADVDRLHPIIYEYIDGDPQHVRTNCNAINELFSTARGAPVRIFDVR